MNTARRKKLVGVLGEFRTRVTDKAITPKDVEFAAVGFIKRVARLATTDWDVRVIFRLTMREMNRLGLDLTRLKTQLGGRKTVDVIYLPSGQEYRSRDYRSSGNYGHRQFHSSMTEEGETSPSHENAVRALEDGPHF